MIKDMEQFFVDNPPEKRAFIGGRYVSATNGAVMEKKNSYQGFDLSGIADCNEADVDSAVQCAKQAFDSGVWCDKSVAEKKEIILRLADLMEQNREEIAALDTIETCRSFQNYYYDSIPKAIEAMRYFAEAIDKVYDRSITGREAMCGIVKRVPLGVVGIITPWNDPMVVTMWKVIPSLLMGNCVVVKPAEQSSLSTIRVAALAKEAGIPDGVFNVVPGKGEIAGKALALHKDVRGIFFTGSSEVGKKLMTYAGESNMKKVGLECGGKGPYLVSDKCRDVALAAKTLADNMFYNQGQICSAPSRVIVHTSVKDEFIEKLKESCDTYIPGNPYLLDSRVGCVVSREQFEKVNSYIAYAKQQGYQVYQPQWTNPLPSGACAILPTVIWGVPLQDRLVKEEIFGPVVVVLEADSMEEAVCMANASDYGLAGAVWTDEINEAYWVSEKVQVGLMHINSYGEDDNAAPFGGVKESGLGKDKSVYAFDEYSDLKTIWMKFR